MDVYNSFSHKAKFAMRTEKMNHAYMITFRCSELNNIKSKLN
jgi:hypothetical protein